MSKQPRRFPLQWSLLFLGLVLFIVGYNNCGGVDYANLSGNFSAPSITAPLSLTGNESYVIPMSIGEGGNLNIPFVTVTICQPGSTICVTLDHILVDTGSVGLRVFASLTGSLVLPQLKDSSGHSLAECQAFADGTADWGPITRADVQMGQEYAASVPIQLINSTFGKPPSDCTGLEDSPSDAGYNGILGVGLFAQDCGDKCNGTFTNNRTYFDCSSASTNCQHTSIAVDPSLQATNPVVKLPVDNNGVILQIPNVVSSGSPAINGYLIFGIGTQLNNAPYATVKTLGADSKTGDFATSLSGKNYNAFIDSGSNGLFFPAPASSGLTACADYDGAFFCPSNTLNFTATQTSSDGLTSVSVPFGIINADKYLAQVGFYVYNDIGGPFNTMFDWGLPFFLGRTVFIGIENQSSSLGMGPYWAF